MNKPIILVDFSKVISPIGISRHLSNILSQYVSLSRDEIRAMYKSHIWLLVKGEFPIMNFVKELLPFLKPTYTEQDLINGIKAVPPISHQFLNTLKVLKKTHLLYLASDIYPELGKQVKRKLSQYFDRFIFSFQEGYKKSEVIFWEQLKKKFPLQQITHFIDDKQENLDLAAKYGIKGILYNPKVTSNDIFKQVYPNKDTIILGAGAAGIHYASLLKEHNHEYIILEKENTPFWLMKSYPLGNSFYDLWWHALHNHNTQVIDFLKTKWILSDTQKRMAFIDYKSLFIPFPFQLHLRYLDQKEREKCLKDFLKIAIISQKKKPTNLDEYLQLTFGSSIYYSFLKPYNYKIRKTDLDLIGINWKKRISYENFDTILRWYLEKNDKNYWTNSQVNYPQQWGFQSYLIPFLNQIKHTILYEIAIKEIDYKHHLIHTSQGTYSYNKLISTIPLNQLLEYCSINKYREVFHYLSLQVIAILTKKKETTIQRIYNKDRAYYHHKLAINSNSSFAMKNLNETLFQFEITWKNGKKKSKLSLKKNALKYLLDKEFIAWEQDILQIEFQEIEYAYPIQTLAFLKKKKKIIKELNTLSIYPLGRFWAREYHNYDDVLMSVFNLYRTLEDENFVI